MSKDRVYRRKQSRKANYKYKKGDPCYICGSPLEWQVKKSQKAKYYLACPTPDKHPSIKEKHEKERCLKKENIKELRKLTINTTIFKLHQRPEWGKLSCSAQKAMETIVKVLLFDPGMKTSKTYRELGTYLGITDTDTRKIIIELVKNGFLIQTVNYEYRSSYTYQVNL